MNCLITTSREPTRRIRSFIKDLNKVIPGSVRVNRGKKSVEDLARECLRYGLSRALIVFRAKGNPGKIVFLEVTPTHYSYYPLAIYLKGIKLRREMKVNDVEHSLGEKSRLMVVTYASQGGKIRKAAEVIAEGLVTEYMQIRDIVNLTNLDLYDEYVFLFLTIVQGKKQIRFYIFGDGKIKETGPRLNIKEIRFKGEEIL